MDLGYLTVELADALAKGNVPSSSFKAGRLGDIQLSGTEVLLGDPIKFNKDNIKDYDF